MPGTVSADTGDAKRAAASHNVKGVDDLADVLVEARDHLHLAEALAKVERDGVGRAHEQRRDARFDELAGSGHQRQQHLLRFAPGFLRSQAVDEDIHIGCPPGRACLNARARAAVGSPFGHRVFLRKMRWCASNTHSLTKLCSTDPRNFWKLCVAVKSRASATRFLSGGRFFTAVMEDDVVAHVK